MKDDTRLYEENDSVENYAEQSKESDTVPEVKQAQEKEDDKR